MSLHERLAKVKPVDLKSRAAVLNEIKQRLQQRLIAELGSELSTLTDEVRHQAATPSERPDSAITFNEKIESCLNSLLALEKTPLTAEERQKLFKEVTDDIVGYGPLEPFLADPEVTEIMVNNYQTIYIEKNGLLLKTEASFIDEQHLRHLIDKIVGQVGRRIDESSPMVDARLPDGSRVNAIIPPLAIMGAKLTVRKFAADPLTVQDLIELGTLSPAAASFLSAAVRGRLNIIVSGGTGSGKTTTLNVLSEFIPPTERIITIEDAVELQLKQEHVLQLESRPPNIEGKGEVTIRDLVRNSLRMRPDRIIVGEVRGGEALDMLQAMNTGHDGSLSTIHANSPRDALARLETMVLMSGMELPVRAIREQIASAIDLIIQQARLKDGSRRITHITEVQGMEGEIITLQDLFLFDFAAGLDSQGRFLGRLKATGIRPKLAEKIAEQGIELPPELFHLEYFKGS